MTFDAEEFMVLAGTVFEATLGLAIEWDVCASGGNRPRSIVACIHITGGWDGAILMDCPNDVARRAASIMFSKAAGETTRADLQDAIAELLNMIGGNFKALLPGQCFLSLPAVVEGGDYSARVPGSTVFGKIAFGCENDVVSVVILEKVSRKVAASSEI